VENEKIMFILLNYRNRHMLLMRHVKWRKRTGNKRNYLERIKVCGSLKLTIMKILCSSNKVIRRKL
jgi:hypothetical protein